MSRKAVVSDGVPLPIGPYSQAIGAGELIFCSGLVGADPQTGAVSGDVRAQARRVMANLEAVLAGAGVGFDAVVKTTLFLVDLADFAAVNEVYGACFAEAPPARTTIQVSALPRGAHVEVEAIAVRR